MVALLPGLEVSLADRLRGRRRGVLERLVRVLAAGHRRPPDAEVEHRRGVVLAPVEGLEGLDCVIGHRLQTLGTGVAVLAA